MPCDTITTQQIDLKNADPVILAEALESLGLKAVIQGDGLHASNGTTDFTWTKGLGGEIRGRATYSEAVLKQTYARTAVTWAAKRAGWNVSQTANNKLQIVRR